MASEHLRPWGADGELFDHLRDSAVSLADGLLLDHHRAAWLELPTP